MTIVLFKIATGEKFQEFETEEAARVGMRTVNGDLGWSRNARSWIDGIEREWGTDPNGEKNYAPFGITESERWDAFFRPEFVSQRIENGAYQEESWV